MGVEFDQELEALDFLGGCEQTMPLFAHEYETLLATLQAELHSFKDGREVSFADIADHEARVTRLRLVGMKQALFIEGILDGVVVDAVGAG